MQGIILILISITLAVSGQLLLKKGMLTVKEAGELSFARDGIAHVVFRVLSTPAVLLGFSCFILSSVSWLTVLYKVPLSYAYPMVSFGYVLVALASKVFFDETVSFIRCLMLFMAFALGSFIGTLLFNRLEYPIR